MHITLPTELNIPAHLVAIIGRIDNFNGSWKATQLLTPDKLERLKSFGRARSPKSSKKTKEEDAGYLEVMEKISSQLTSIKISEDYIKEIHATLFKYSPQDQDHRGLYKTQPNASGAFRNGVFQGILSMKASPEETPALMKQLVAWHDDVVNKGWHPLVITGLFILVFTAIHPFKDGNGRMLRIIANILMIRFGYDYARYSNLESLIQDHRHDYLKSMTEAENSLSTEAPNYTIWLECFLKLLELQIKCLCSADSS